MGTTAASLWLLNLFLDTTGQLVFKRAAVDGHGAVQSWPSMLRQKWVWLGVLCYGIEFFCWLAFLTLMPLSAAVLLSTANIITVAIGGWLLFGERPTMLRSCGMALVAIGVFLVGAG